MSTISTADAQVRTRPRFVYIDFKSNAAMTLSPALYGQQRHPTKQ